MATGKKNQPVVHKLDTRERMKKIISSIFVALLSFALVLLFVASDLLKMSGGGKLTIASINGKDLSRMDPKIQNIVKLIQDKDKKTTYAEALRQARGEYIRQSILLLAAREGGISAGEKTIIALTRSYARANNTTITAIASRASRRGLLALEKYLVERFLRTSVSSDMMQAGRATHLELSLTEGLNRRKVALTAAVINLNAYKTVSDATLKDYYGRNKQQLSTVYHPISITVDSRADAEKLLKSIKAEDMKTIQAQAVVHGVKVNPYDAGWIFPLGQNASFYNALRETKTGGFTKAIPFNGRQVIFFLKEKKTVSDFASLGQEGLQALNMLYRDNNSAAINLDAEKKADAVAAQLKAMIRNKKLSLTQAAAKLGLKTVKAPLFGFSDKTPASLALPARTPDFTAAAFSLAKGAVSQTIKSGDTWYLLQATDVKMLPDRFKKLRDKKLDKKTKKVLVAAYRKAIIDLSKQNSWIAYRDWMYSLYNKYDVRVNDQHIK